MYFLSINCVGNFYSGLSNLSETIIDDNIVDVC